MTNSSRVGAGVAGAVVGYIAIFVLFSVLDMGNRADPITSGLLALFVYSPSARSPVLCLPAGW
ncbi:hypothetical protein ACU4GH_29200 [Bradyrhizobium betae]